MNDISARAWLFAMLASACQCCTPSNVTPPPPDASDAMVPPSPPVPPAPVVDAAPAPPLSECDKACAALTAAGCSMGSSTGCSAVLARDFGSGKVSNAATGMPMTCADVVNVKTKADAQRIGFVCK